MDFSALHSGSCLLLGLDLSFAELGQRSAGQLPSPLDFEDVPSVPPHRAFAKLQVKHKVSEPAQQSDDSKGHPQGPDIGARCVRG
jgi:hypothetical protein